MKILTVKRIEYFYVATDEEVWNVYRRDVNDDAGGWENLMGSSWEPCLDADEIEAAFQEWQSR